MLIVLAITACLVAIIATIGGNAVKKAKAAKVAKSLKVLVNQFENIVLLGDDPPTVLQDLTRDIPSDYGVMYSGSGNNCSVVAYYTGEVDFTELNKLLKAACSELIELDSPTVLAGSCDKDGNVTASYGTIVGGKTLGIGKLEIVNLDNGKPEIVYVRNVGSGDINTLGWRVKKIYSKISDTKTCRLREITLKPGQEIRIYSNIDGLNIEYGPYDEKWETNEVWDNNEYKRVYLCYIDEPISFYNY